MTNNENKFPWTYETEQPQPQPVAQNIPLEAEPAVIAQPAAEPQPEPAIEPQSAPAPVYEAPAQPVKKEKKKKPVGIGAVIAVALVCSLLGGMVGAVGATLIMKGSSLIPGKPDTSIVLEGERENTVIDIHKIDTNKLMTPAEVYAANVNSTVGITTAITTNFWGYQTTSAASGSGFIISKDGYILTNHHVIEDSTSITVSFYDGSSKEAKLIGYDASNDIAVLKVEATDLTPVILGNSNNLNVGDSVVAIGNPLGELTFSLTAGAVSALDREVTISNGTAMRLIQTDCAINSGNSGGALFNLYGEVIGITNAKYSSNSSSEASIDNIGFAIPLNNVRSIVESIIEKGYVTKPYIGVSIQDVSEETQSYGLPKGAAVKGVVEGSPAEKAGLMLNDIITHVDGNEISGSSALVTYVGQCEIGQVLKLTVFRQGQSIQLEITVGEQTQAANAQQQQPQQQQPQQQQPQQQQPQQQIPFEDMFPFWNFGF